MGSLDRCPKCGRGLHDDPLDRARKLGNRIRYLKCTDCGNTGVEFIAGPARPRRKKTSNLEHRSRQMVHFSIALWDHPAQWT